MESKADHSTIPSQETGEVIPLSGRLTLRDARAICARLREAMAGSNRITIDIQDLKSLDVAVVQLLLAARKSAEQQHKSLSIYPLPSEALQTILIESGLAGHGGDDGERRDAFGLASNFKERQDA
ncbi:STAS domain-containing protein [Ciceribacter sp. RN22]|uniref:STAS domain-containing protein n=1 Tax=Ciceribacter sp. RN22 TaxID=2954932 RepID=UPI002092E768|nr:STAS domain-containing protein [Ciceribacter sp. RN22]MCO6179147.1 STAS domain-containing protein [Ciceribacter sp. RN22]